MAEDSPMTDVNGRITPESSTNPTGSPIHQSASEFSFSNFEIPAAPPPPPPRVFETPSAANFANKGLQRSIALALRQVGFDAATPAALDAFAQHAEIFLERLIHDVQTLSLAARRNIPTPNDFQLVLRRRQVTVESLSPHRKHPIPRHLLRPKIVPVKDLTPTSILTSLPILHPDLSGTKKRNSMAYIPPQFPDFPSIHTFRYTPHMEKTQRDSQKIRAAAALAAKQGEDALRSLVRAAKVRKQKEVRSIVQREPNGRERYRLWEAAMQQLLSDKVPVVDNGEDGSRPRLSDQEIADASMIVNSAAPYLRQELPKSGAGKKPLPRTTLEIQGR